MTGGRPGARDGSVAVAACDRLDPVSLMGARMHRLSPRAPMGIAIAAAIGLTGAIGPWILAGQSERTIRGTVTVEDDLLPTGRVTVHPADDPPISARLKDGRFSMADVPPGSHAVSIDAEGIAKRYADPASSGLSIRVDDRPGPIRVDLRAEGIEVGQPAPHILAHGPDGNIVDERGLRGKLVLLAFWFTRSPSKAVERQYALLREIRREFRGHEEFLIISLCADVMEEEGRGNEFWNEFILGQPPINDGKGKHRLIDDSRWWQCMGIAGVNALPTAPRFGVRRVPRLFLIGPDGRFAAVRIPEAMLREEIRKALASARGR